MPKSISVVGLEEFPLIGLGDDLPRIIIDVAARQGVPIEDGDVVVVGHKIVSKAEGRVVRLRDVEPSPDAIELANVTGKDPRFVEFVLKEARRVVKAVKRTLIVETVHGWTCLSAGLDKSNVPGEDSYSLLPRDPDGSARQIRQRIQELTGKRVGVVVTDTYSRPFRRGQVDFAIGVAGIRPFKDYRGQLDLFKRRLRIKYIGIADEIASAAELIIGQGAEGIPVAIIKGLSGIEWDEKASFNEVLLSREEDYFTGVK